MLAKSLFVLAAAAAGVNAQFPSSTPACATSCFTIKISEAGSLAPGVNPTNIAGLCSVRTFIQAFVNCCNDNCASAAEVATSVALAQQVCASSGVAIPTTGYTGAASGEIASLSSIPIATVSGGASGSVGSATPTASAVSSMSAGAPASASSAMSAASGAASGASASAGSVVSGASSAASGAVASASSATSVASSGAGSVADAATSGAASVAGAATSGAKSVASAATSVAGAVTSALAAATSRAASPGDKVALSGVLGFVAGVVALFA